MDTISGDTITIDDVVTEHKRLILVYVITGLWVALGILGTFVKIDFGQLAVYFLTLTGFAGSYIISETKRPAQSTTIFKRGPNSKREILIYVVTALWLVLAIVCMVKKLDLLQASAYFGSLTPYVSTYLIGAAYKPDLPTVPPTTSAPSPEEP